MSLGERATRANEVVGERRLDDGGEGKMDVQTKELVNDSNDVQLGGW